MKQIRAGKRSASLFLSGLLLLAVAAPAQQSIAERFRLFHKPSDMKMAIDGFRVDSGTRIFVEFGHQSEDRIAAETLVDQIENQSGMRIGIIGAKAGSKRDHSSIVLARLQDPHMREFLESKGLKADASVGEQGYLLFSDKSHLIVAANTGQGLFNGVQTLRQMLRPEGKDVICPAIAMRDWPGFQGLGGASIGPL